MMDGKLRGFKDWRNLSLPLPQGIINQPQFNKTLELELLGTSNKEHYGNIIQLSVREFRDSQWNNRMFLAGNMKAKSWKQITDFYVFSWSVFRWKLLRPWIYLSNISLYNFHGDYSNISYYMPKKPGEMAMLLTIVRFMVWLGDRYTNVWPHASLFTSLDRVARIDLVTIINCNFLLGIPQLIM